MKVKELIDKLSDKGTSVTVTLNNETLHYKEARDIPFSDSSSKVTDKTILNFFNVENNGIYGAGIYINASGPSTKGRKKKEIIEDGSKGEQV